VHLPLPLHKSGQPSAWRDGEHEREGREATPGKQGSHAKGEQACRAATGPASQWGPYLPSRELRGSRPHMQEQDRVGRRCREFPMTTDPGARGRAILPK
jgi:hypothetical protein